MSDFLRFPSRVTVAQVKKDAKAVSKADGIPLHQALDLLAARHGMAMPWHTAIAQLKIQADNPTIARFSLNSGDSLVSMSLTKERPIGIMVGRQSREDATLGSLMTMSFLEGCPGRLHWVSVYPAMNRYTPVAFPLSATHASKHRGRWTNTVVDGHPAAQKFGLERPSIAAARGDLFVIEDFNDAMAITPTEYLEAAAERGYATLLVVDSTDEIKHVIPKELISFVIGANTREGRPTVGMAKLGQGAFDGVQVEYIDATKFVTR
ncbi:TPA: hypothetical protein NIA45_004796 [Pseudomonas aeruginosa]|nr:hypothetical protein [Pseudomonas aeruginosa]